MATAHVGLYDVDTAKVWYSRKELCPVNIHFEFEGTEPDVTVSLTEDEARLLQGQLTALLAALETVDKFSTPG